MNPVSSQERFRKTGVLLFQILFLICLLYQLQFYLPYLFSAPARSIEFFCVFIFAGLCIYKEKLEIGFAGLLGWIVYAIGVAAYTSFTHDAHLALHAFLRFLNVMMLAPLAYILIRDERQIRAVMWLFIVAVIVGAASLCYQLLGGELPKLVRGYLAIRGDLIRYKTALGEPNVGGMAVIVAFLFTALCVQKNKYAIPLILIFLIFAVLSLSKAGLFGLMLAGLIVLGYYLYQIALRKTSWRLIILRFGGAILLALIWLYLFGGWHYISVAIDVIQGNVRGEPSVLKDFMYRQSTAHIAGSTWIKFLFGNGFGIAGSAAQELLGMDANVVLPHNSYNEVFLVGGLCMLSLLVAIQLLSVKRLFKRFVKSKSALDLFLLAAFCELSLIALTYPVIYEPVTGAIFWTLIGIALADANNKENLANVNRAFTREAA